jgi:hypothetical protein
MHPNRLTLPDLVNSDHEAFEIVTVWVTSNRKVVSNTRAGTGLDMRLDIWGGIMKAIAGNIALNREATMGIEPSVTMAAIKESLDRAWEGGTTGTLL